MLYKKCSRQMLYKMYKCTNVVQKMFQTNDVQKTKTHILCSMILVFFENRGVYEIICQKKNIVEPKRPQTTIWRMSISRCIHKATNTHSEYVIIIAFPLQQLLNERASLLCYRCIVSCYCSMTRLA